MIHVSHLKGKFWEDREIEHAVEFLPSGTFAAYYNSTNYLKDMGYSVGSMCLNHPIGFAYHVNSVAKWVNLTQEEKDSVDGVILAQHEFREGGVIILFFNPPRY